MVRGSFYPKDDHSLELINYLLFLFFAFFLAMDISPPLEALNELANLELLEPAKIRSSSRVRIVLKRREVRIGEPI